jgi:hypothetical protein
MMGNEMPSKIMIIRHGEKPDGPAASGEPQSRGLLENGEPSEYGLAVRGWQRAGALAVFFGHEGAAFRPQSLATPDIIFASGIGPESKSLRMQQTVEPLRRKLGPAVKVNFDCKKGEEERLAAAALQSEGCVLICWSHEGIPLIAANILGGPNAAPTAWPEERYDLVWAFDRNAGALAWTFRQEPQMLLAGDCPDSIRSSVSRR